MKQSKFKTQFIKLESSSSFNEKIRKIFMEDSFFKYLKCFQEVNVIDLIPDYEYPKHRVDWYIKELNCILEIHGQQHYNMVNFGSKPWLAAYVDFNEGKYRDNSKRTALENAGYSFYEISYKDIKNLTGEDLKRLLTGDTNGIQR